MGLSARAQVAHLPVDGESLTVLPAGGGGKTGFISASPPGQLHIAASRTVENLVQASPC
jgi:hypothetical protein